MEDEHQAKLTLDGVEYNINDLSDEAKVQLQNLRFSQGLISRLRGELAVAETGQATYVRALKEILEKK